MTTVPALTDEAALAQYVATGGQTDFNFSYMIFATADIEVYVNGVLKTETTHYTVKKSNGTSISASDLPLDGGKVVFVSGLTANDEVSLNRNIAIARLTGYSVAGAFRADVVNAEFTKALAISQQLRRDVERAIRLAAFDSEGGDLTLPTGRAGKLIGFDSDGNIAVPLEWANIQSDLSTLVAIADDITTAVGIAADISAVAAIASDVSAVQDIAANVTTVAGISANVTTVAGISANVTTVAGIASAVSSCATNMTSIQNAASFGFPTLASGDEYKMLQIKADRSGYNAVEALSRRNAIINGAFDIWQENSSFTSAADGTYTADMWVYGKKGVMVHDISRSTDVPTVAQAGRLFNYSALIDCQTVDSSIGSTDICAFEQKIEGYNWLPLAQKALVLSFWVKATKTGTYCVSLRNNRSGTPDRSYVAEYTVSQSDTWEFKTITITASPSAGTWNYTNGNGCSLSFCLAGGSSFQTTAGAWQTGNYLCTSNQVNACDSTSNNFRVTAVQLEVGSLPTPFEGRTFQEERRLCQRYWESSYEYGSAPGTSSDNGKFSYSVSSSGGFIATVPFKVVKRTTSSNTFYSTTGASGNLRNETSAADTAASPAMSSETGVGISKGGLTSGHSISGHFVANARL